MQDFWVAALWKKLMGVRVLGANQTARADAEATAGEDEWVWEETFKPERGMRVMPQLEQVGEPMLQLRRQAALVMRKRGTTCILHSEY